MPAGRSRQLTARGERRREALIQAAVELLKTVGFGALTHRAVAARSGLPLAATTYYFVSREELIEVALRRLGEPMLQHARDLVASLGPGPVAAAEIAPVIVRLVAGTTGRGDRAQLLTFYERYVEAGRHPNLRPIVRAWTDELVRLVRAALRRAGYTCDPTVARLLVAVVDGVLLGVIVESDAEVDIVAAASPGVGAVLRGLLRAPDRPFHPV